ncbi:MAG: trypsin-like peptidase domain-containing protein [Lachnospiraceae bacterium]|nr:trypsin-like peptidase domain-containing protein [Lachnospiraceae bacterium]
MYNENDQNLYGNHQNPDSNGQGSEQNQQTEGNGYTGAGGQDNGQPHNYYNDRYRGGQQSGSQNPNNNGSGSYNGQNNGYGGYNGQNNGYNSYNGQNNGYNSCNGQNNGYDGGYGNGNGYYNGGFSGGSDNFNGKKPKKKSSGLKIALAVGLVAVFVGFCGGISWLAVNTIEEQMSAKTEKSVSEEEANAENEANAGEAANAGDEAKPAVSDSVQKPVENQIEAAGTIRESGNVTAVVTDVTDVVEKVMPASVCITNNFTEQVQDFWGQTYSQDEQSSGSGIIIGENETELLIVSNNHVVEDSDSLQVQFIDGEIVDAQVKGTDSAVDLAVIAVKLDDIKESTKSEIRVAQMGDSDNLRIGEPAIAIGNALGYGQSVTTGVISALNRTLEVSETGTSTALIQTDAAINPGNSGGALLNINGEVVGINSNKIGGTVVEGMGYAIPISTAKPIIEELMTHETKAKVSDEERGYLGISCINVTSELSQNYNMPEGVFVAQVYEGTGADKAGLVRGDIITAFDGVTIKDQSELTKQMSYYKEGETVEITIMQGSPTGYQAKNVQITLSSYEELNESSQQSEQQEQQQESSGRSRQIWP